MANLEKLLRTAYQYEASDLYMTTGAKPTLRINGKLVVIEEHSVITKEQNEQYILEIMTPEQKRHFEQGLDIDFSFNTENIARFRANIFVQRKGIGATFRLIPQKIKTIEDLNLPPILKKISNFRSGLVLATGPTGSGKSTTLAAILDEINKSKEYHILTIEDPIEFLHENKKSIVDQREVGTHTTSFHRALRAGLREDTNVILIGELRDPETFALALTAAETGHLVLGSIHTSGTENAIYRIIDSFPAEQHMQVRSQLAESLRAILWQNLVECKDKKNRIAAMEILLNNKAIANLIRKGHIHQIPSIVETRGRDGMQTMRKALNDLAEIGAITKEEAIANMPTEVEVN